MGRIYPNRSSERQPWQPWCFITDRGETWRINSRSGRGLVPNEINAVCSAQIDIERIMRMQPQR